MSKTRSFGISASAVPIWSGWSPAESAFISIASENEFSAEPAAFGEASREHYARFSNRRHQQALRGLINCLLDRDWEADRPDIAPVAAQGKNRVGLRRRLNDGFGVELGDLSAAAGMAGMAHGAIRQAARSKLVPPITGDPFRTHR